MLSTVHAINILLPLMYVFTFIIYVYNFIREGEKVNNVSKIFLFVTLLFHIFYLITRTFEFNHPTITNRFEIFSVLSFALGFSYFILELLTDVKKTGAFIVFFSLIFQLISSIFIQDSVEVNEVLRSKLLGIHVMSALLGYSGFTIAAVYGGLFFLLYRDIKLNRYGILFKRLPSLEILEKLNFYSVIIGFILLTISMLIGFFWLPISFPDFSYFDPKLISSVIVWIVFGIGILAKLFAKLYGKKVIIFSLVGFLIVLGSLLVTNLITESFHTFS